MTSLTAETTVILPGSPINAETPMTNTRTFETRADASKTALTEAQLDTVSGGAPHSVTSPRDAASGLPAGKRMHGPFILRMF